MFDLTVALRGAAFALQLLLALLLLRDARRVRAARYGALFTLGTAAAMVAWAPLFAGDHALWLIPLRVLSFGGAAVFWLLATALFDDEFEPSWIYGAAWVVLVGLGLGGFYSSSPRAYLGLNSLRLLLVFLALWQVLVGRATDLVEGRRRLRVILVVSVGLFNAGIIVSIILLRGGDNSPWFAVVDPLGSAILTFFFATLILSVDGGTPLLSLALARIDAPPRAPAPAAPGAEPEDERLLAALRGIMEQQKAYREEGLSIATLAAKLGIPEYRLRRLINQRLGHRNFSAFLNGHRLADAMAALADPTQSDVPILTIALDAGFQSIGPFNRAFKAEAGMTPTEFRRQRAKAESLHS
jgi:AraC-like DNA-binding protein